MAFSSFLENNDTPGEKRRYEEGIFVYRQGDLPSPVITADVMHKQSCESASGLRAASMPSANELTVASPWLPAF